jgi:predicted MFS family arabinose efflux permease
VQAGGLLAAMGIFDLIGTTASGWLSDRFSSRWLLFWYYGLRGLSLIYLPAAFGIASIGLPVFAVFYGLDWIATVPPTLQLTTAQFGRLRAPLMFGWIFTGHQLGASLIAYVAGAIRTDAGSYDSAFVLSGVLCMLAAVMVLFIGRTATAPVPAVA